MLKRLIFASLFAGIVCIQPGATQQGGSPTEPSFDVVSIRAVDAAMRQVGPSTWSGPPHKNCQYLPDRVMCQLSLKQLIEDAYQLKRFQVAGPDWLDSSLFALQATVPPDTSNEAARLMLQHALAERFGVRAHHEKRIIPIYALVIGKNGVKLKPADDPAHRVRSEIKTPGGTIKAASFFGGGRFYSMASTLDELAGELNSFGRLDLPVVNMTGLAGEYKFDMRWVSEEETNGFLTGKDPGFVTAVEQQLGLRLERRKVPYDVLVVDHAERIPSEN